MTIQNITDDTRLSPFHMYWKSRSDLNSSIYNWIDGEDVSIYRCTKLSQLKNGLKNYQHKLSTDSITTENLEKVKGFLINWPVTFLQDENLMSSTYISFLTTDIWL